MRQEDSIAVQKAKAIIRGEAVSPGEALRLTRQLKKEDQFRWGHRVLKKVSRNGVTNPALRLKIAQERALCTYKDPDRPALEALGRAHRILAEGDDVARTEDQETLGLAGAIHRRLWQATGQRQHLERSLHYYRRGHQLDPMADEGYTSINAAFILDQLAKLEKVDASYHAEERRREARNIRTILAERLPKLLGGPKAQDLATNWWYLVTVAEAFFGLGNYSEAAKWLQKARALPGVADWEFRSTGLQLAAHHHHQLQQSGTPAPSGSEAARVLEAFVGSGTARTSAFVGKVGLALSGGGFRASLFHIGVLARLAEVDLLRHVEVLSCVSSGSIIGAYYYLQLREVLETTDLEVLDDDTVRDVYIGIVQRIAADCLAGVQRNIRTRVFANPFPMLRALFDRGYSRTTRLGELLEKEMFARVFRDASPERRPPTPLCLNAFAIQPKDVAGKFEPGRHNWRRRAKVPVLVLNATTLNTGHNWQYTVRFMGESPHAIDPHVDGNNRLRRVYYPDAPKPYREVRLGQAVVASACVPGLFEPIRLVGLYERGEPAKPFVVRQVDGGVHDNQGIASLLEQDCSVVLVSDASGQTATAADPGGGVVAPSLRSNAVLMQRVRQEQFACLKARRDGGLLKGMMFIHLKQDLDVEPVDWHGCEEPPEDGDPTHLREARTCYGVRKKVQRRLAGMRTDLDSFSEVEAFALMTSGYRMAKYFLPEVDVLPARPERTADWAFLAIEPVMTEAHTTDASYRRLVKLLETGGGRFFRAWRQSQPLLLGSITVVTGLTLLLLAILVGAIPPTITLTVSQSTLGAVAAVTCAAILALLVPKVREHAGRIGVGFLTLVVWIPAQLHLRLVDRLFLWRGRLGRLR